MLSTSGSTGSPKLVRLSRDNLASNASAIADYLALGPRSRAMTTLPPHYSYGLSVINSHFAAGGTIVLNTASPTDEMFWRTIDAQGVTSLAGVPHSYELYERMGLRARALPTLETLTQAGGRLAPELVERYADWAKSRGARFFVMYGATEATARMSYLPPALAGDHPASIGMPIPGGAFTIRKEDGTAAAPGETGQLFYRGPNVMMGYAESVEELALPPSLGELDTGDLAVRSPDGLYRIVGRTSRFSKLFGLRISLDRIEEHIRTLGQEAWVAGDDRAIAVLVPRATPGLAAALGEHFAIPGSAFRIVERAEPPRLASGKIDYPGILSLARNAATDDATPDPDRGSVRSLFEQSFPGRGLTAQDSFLSLGGDSLSFVDFSMRLEDLLGFLPSDWESMTLAELVALDDAPASHKADSVIESSVLIRALAIVGVVNLHAHLGFTIGVEIGGGAELLMLLVGYNLARFQRGRLAAGDWRTVLAPLFWRVVIPYCAVLAAYAAYKGLDLPSLLLVSNFVGRFGNILEPFWFVEALMQCTVAITLLFLLRPVARFSVRRPWRFALALMAGAVLLRLTTGLLLDHTTLLNRTADAMLILVALGWAVHAAATLLRKLLVVTLAIATSMISWGPVDSHVAWMAGGIVFLVLLPRVPAPPFVRALVGTVAAASWEIYLTHGFVLRAFAEVPGVPLLVPQVAAILIGVLLAWVWTRLRPRLHRQGRFSV